MIQHYHNSELPSLSTHNLFSLQIIYLCCIHLMTLSVAHITQCYVTGQLVNNEWCVQKQ